MSSSWENEKKAEEPKTKLVDAVNKDMLIKEVIESMILDRIEWQKIQMVTYISLQLLGGFIALSLKFWDRSFMSHIEVSCI